MLLAYSVFMIIICVGIFSKQQAVRGKLEFRAGRPWNVPVPCNTDFRALLAHKDSCSAISRFVLNNYLISVC